MSWHCRTKQTAYRFTPKMRIDYGAWLETARQQLNSHEQPRMEAQIILSQVTGVPRAGVLAHPERMLSSEQVDQLTTALNRLIRGEPLPYVLGYWEFYGRRFEITPEVLIPRPETELLVELAEDWLRSHPGSRSAVDVGTGSGCIAVSLALGIPDLHILAVDRSLAAVKVARRNALNMGADRLRVAVSDLLTAVSGSYNLITANLPYIPTRKLTHLAVARQEPLLALDGGVDGLELIERLLKDAYRWLAPDGMILLEIETDHGRSVPEIARRLIPGVQVDMIRDLAGKPRVVRIERRP